MAKVNKTTTKKASKIESTTRGVDFLKQVIKATKNEYASIVADGTVYDSRGHIDVGNYLLNMQLCGDMFEGMTSNTCTCFAGAEGVGKTYLVLGIIKNFLEDNPEGVVTLFESEGAIKKKTLEDRQIDTTRCSIFPIATIEKFRFECNQIIENYASMPDKERFPLLIALDSLGMLSNNKEISDAEKGDDKSDMGGHAKRVKATFRVIRQKLAKYNIPLILTNHLFSDPGAYIPTMKVAGGTGLKYAADSIVILNKKKLKDGMEGFSDGGISVTCKADKMRDARPFTEIPFIINFNKGVTRYSGLFDFCYETGIIVREGMRYKFNDEIYPLYEKTFTKPEAYREPEKMFTQEVLEKVNEFAKPLFNFGAVEVIPDFENEEDDMSTEEESDGE